MRREASRVRQFLREGLGMKCLKVAPIPVRPEQTIEEHARTPAAFLNGGAGTDVGAGG